MTSPAGSPAIAGMIVDRIERWWRPLLVVLLVGEAALLAIAAIGRPYWHDEICTLVTAALPLTTLRDAYLGGADLSLPLNTLTTHLVSLSIGLGPISGRLPAMAGFLTASALIVVFVRRRSNATVAFAAAMLWTGTMAWRYGTEARGYGLSLACAAVAWYGWTEAAAGRRTGRSTALMGLGLMAGLWTHHYFVLAFLPIAAGELVRQFRSGRFDARPWATLGFSALALVPLLPLIQVAAAQRSTFWARPRIVALVEIYPELVGWLAGPLLVLGALLAWFVLPFGRRATPDGPVDARRLPVPAHEMAAACVAFAMPAAGVLLGFVTHAFAARYLTFSTVALVVVAVLAIWRRAPPGRSVNLAFVGAGTCVLLATTWVTVTGTTRWRPAEQHPLLVERLRAGEETAVAGSIAYLQFWYYAEPSERTHAIYLAEPVAELERSGSNTVDLGYLALSRFVPLRVVPLQAFDSSRSRFMLYVIGQQWQEDALRARGATLTVVATDQGGTLYDVKTKAGN